MKFSELNIDATVLKNIEQLGYSECTPIQEKSIPLILSKKDIAGLAQTGTGKTAAFLIPLIDRVLASKKFPHGDQGNGSQFQQQPQTQQKPQSIEQTLMTQEAQRTSLAQQFPQTAQRSFGDWRVNNFVLILVPTRELAEQVFDNFQKLSEGTGLKAISVYGGTGYEKQIGAIKSGVEFVIATPGRLIDLFKEHYLDLKQVRAIVFDEADRMFDMGFKDDMKYILQRIPRERQFLVLSATLNFDVLNTAYQFGAEPVEINISKDQAKAENVKDAIFHVGDNEKPQQLLSMLKKYNPKQCIIFTNFKHNVEKIAAFLNDNGVSATAISSLLTQSQRNSVLEQFKSENHVNILVATDVAARGLDVQGVDLVINYELPQDSETYVHRIGRTGRAGTVGTAYSLVSDKDIDSLMRIEDYLKHKLVTEFMESSDLITEFKQFPKEDVKFSKRFEGRQGPQRRDNKNSGGYSSNKKRFEKRGPDRRYSDNKYQGSRTDGEMKSEHVGPHTGQNSEKKSHKPHLHSKGQKHKHKKNLHHSSDHKHKKHDKFKSKSHSHVNSQKSSSIGQKIKGFIKSLFGN